MQNIVVSVFCTAYNHKKYIAQCLDSIIRQETNFSYEVLVHDDASTDGTTEIIREYERKYPELIIAIYQSENQYSQQKSISLSFLLPRARGKYIAICEGDDYWVDKKKLQKQVDLMEKHPEIDMCTHAAQKVQDEKIVGYVMPEKKEKLFLTDEIIRGGGELFMTNSIMYRQSMKNSIPRFAQYMLYDYSLTIWGSLRGGILYIPDVMSAYRVLSEGSWTMMMRKDTSKKINHLKRVEKMEQMLLEEIDERYRKTIEEDLINIHIRILECEGNYSELSKPIYRNQIKGYSVENKLKMLYRKLKKKWM